MRVTISPMHAFKWILPLSVLMGAALAAVQPGAWWRGALVFALLCALGLWSLRLAWAWAGGGRALGWAMALALGLRLLSALAWTTLLPTYGYDTPQQNAGYVFYDAFRRDGQAWDLARSGDSLLNAFNQSYAADQYGGLLGFSALLYRVFSPDAHRSLLLVLAGAWAAALGLAFARKAIAAAWGESFALPAVWLLALYPESVLQGSAQMREPFLIMLVTVAVWGFVSHFYAQARAGRGWLLAGAAGLLLVSPGVALFLAFVLAGWWWFGVRRGGISWRWLAGLAAVIAAALFVWGTAGGFSLPAALGWFLAASQWDILLLERSSGWVQKLFTEMPAGFQVPFVAVYGVLQPVLPAALVEPALPIWQTLGILRALGWYALLPFLAFGALSLAWRREAGRRLWVWMAAAGWLWIVIAALRAGGDQWDNPRYRVIFLLIQALLFAYAWQARRNVWFWRIVAVEGVFLFFFTHWYISRYYVLFGQLPFFVMVALIVVVGALILAGGAAWDAWRARRPA